jgi:hypothetical protein
MFYTSDAWISPRVAHRAGANSVVWTWNAALMLIVIILYSGNATVAVVRVDGRSTRGWQRRRGGGVHDEKW